MSGAAFQSVTGAGLGSSKPVCRILILHQDFSSYALAAEVCRRVMGKFAVDFEFNIKGWNLTELADDDCARHAAKTAKAADIILFSLPSAALPAEFERWQEIYLAGGARSGGVLTLLLNERETSAQALEELILRLNSIAALLGLDFIPLLAGDDEFLQSILPSGTWVAPVSSLAAPEQPVSNHWGLNE
jgi:hypothetical protein